MPQITVPLTCNGCQSVNKLKAKKPSYHTPTIAKYTCKTCDTRYLVSLERTKEAGKVKVDSIPIAIGARLVALKKLEALAKEETSNVEG